MMSRLLIILLTVSLSLLINAGARADNFNVVQKQEIEQIVKQYIMDNPTIIYESISLHENEQEAEQNKKAIALLKEKAGDLFKNPNRPFLGNAKASVTFIEFFDYNCGYCKQALPGLKRAMEQDKDLRIILIDTPILSPQSMTAAQWALAARKMGRYVEFHQALMEFQGPKTEENLIKIATDLKLDVDQIKKTAYSPDVRKEIVANLTLFRQLGLNGTPAFVAGDQLIRGYVGPEVIAQIAKDVRAGKKSATAKE